MEVIVYSSSTCGYCSKQKEFFAANGIVFEERDIYSNPQFLDELKELGGRGVPLTIVKAAGETVSTISGFDKDKLSDVLL